MRLAVFDQNRLGVVMDDHVVAVTALVGAEGAGVEGPLHALLRAGALPAELDTDILRSAPRRPIADVALRAPLPRPGKVVAAPVNYAAHKDEMQVTQSVAELGVFLKANSSVIGPGGSIELPYTDVRTDHEGELAVVIGGRARHLSADQALDHVAGYTCLLDITVRSTEDRSIRKSFDTFTPVGPWLVTADEIADPDDLDLRCWVNDELRQDASTAELIFDVPTLVAYISSVMTLEPGDVVATGTPAGVGPIVDGDLVVVEIDRVGRLAAVVTGARARPYDERPRPSTRT